MRVFSRLITVVPLLALLAGCGGGSGATAPAVPPASTLAQAPQPDADLRIDEATARARVAPEGTQERPGPSGFRFNHPYYSCVHRYYVATTGNDANAGTTVSAPWLTLQHANDAGRAAGDCVVVAPGTYAKGVNLSSGGNAATQTGYVVYRCQVLDACIVTDVGGTTTQGSFAWDTSHQPMTGSYIMIDGFTMRAAQETQFGQGVQLWDGSIPELTRSVHHVWILNSIISGYGQAGVNMNDGEYFYVVHNSIYNNANAGCTAQGSGVGYVVLKAFPNLARTPDDANNPVLGNIGAFNNAVEWNIAFNNATTQCGSVANPYDTDGNDIIIDTLNGAGATNVAYPGSTLVAFNVAYNAGGRGIHVFRSGNVTVANNSCYNSALDPADNGAYRPCIGDNLGYNNTFINNIAYAIPTDAPNSAQCIVDYANQISGSCLQFNSAYVGGLQQGAAQADTFSNNISYCTKQFTPFTTCAPMYNGDAFSCTTNLCNSDPLWVNVGTSSTGTQTTQPIGADFDLQPRSPAIGHGVVEPYLKPEAVDIGACSHLVQRCVRAAARP